MAFEGSFLWSERDKGLERFPIGVVGREEWQMLVQLAANGLLAEAMQVLVRLRDMPEGRPPKRLFISHRQTDKDAALEVRDAAKECKCAYWLDVEDPLLAGLKPDNPFYAILVAAIIEIALLNCTHVVAVLTRNSFGHAKVGTGKEATQSGPSLWIPYEYARAKARTIVSAQAAAWIKESGDPFPEYLNLGMILPGPSTDSIKDWLDSQPTWP